MGQDAVKPLRELTWNEATTSDWALVQLCASGDELACTRLVSDHQRMVYQLSLHLLGDPQEALDLSQEVFLRVFRTLPQFRGHAALRTWIYRIVINQASNRQRWWRRRHRNKQVPLDAHIEAHGDLPDHRGSLMPDRALGQKETAAQVWRALDTLPFDQRTVIVLREIDEMSYDDIADSLGVAVGTIKSRLARARGQLRAALISVREAGKAR